MTTVRALAIVLAAALVTVLWLSGSLGAVAYAAIWALAILPGLPLGFALFGRDHPAAWIGGALLGYALTQMVIWAVIVAGLPSLPAFVVGWLILAACAIALFRSIGPRPVLALPAIGPADLRALLLVLLLVPAVMGPPYRNLGRADDAGNRYYRAYFTADFLWHSALAFELGKQSLPPRNPYLTPRPMNYYWAYFLLPATVAEYAPRAPRSFETVQTCLKANALLNGLLMVGMLFLVVRLAVPHAGAAAVAVALTMLAASAEGTYEIWSLWSRGRSLAELRHINIDAITAWRFDGMRIDNIPRSLWYTPQHTTSVALGLLGWFTAVAGGVSMPLLAIGAAGLALGLATVMNPLLGACFSLVYGVAIAADALTTGGGVRPLLRHVLAAAIVALGVAWGVADRVADGAGDALRINLEGFRHAPLMTILLSLGPVLAPAAAGLMRVRGASQRALAIALGGVATGLFVLYFVRITESSWAGFRAGQILLVAIPILLARALSLLGRHTFAAVAAVVFVIGAPTTIVDTYNAQDIHNREPGPGFRWTLWVTPDQQRAFEWIRSTVPATAVVQMEPIVRGREHWTLVPSFAGRRMAAGLPISLLPLPDYNHAAQQVRTLYASPDPVEGWTIARRLRIDYLYVDAADTSAYPDGVKKFDGNPQQFERVFTSGDVIIYRVN
jgi:hypothetical protein